MEQKLSLSVNGRPVETSVFTTASLLDVLREQLNITSPKKGCDMGDCGTCTVLLDGVPVNSCLVLALSAQGREVTTIEGIGTAQNLHPLQKAFYDWDAAQCGYCSPGIILTAKAFLDKNPDPSRDDVNLAISGNLCRCTGYVKIVDAILDVARSQTSATAAR